MEMICEKVFCPQPARVGGVGGDGKNKQVGGEEEREGEQK